MHRDVLHPYSPHDHQHETIGYHQSEISQMQCSDPCQDTSPCEPSCRLVCMWLLRCHRLARLFAMGAAILGYISFGLIIILSVIITSQVIW